MGTFGMLFSPKDVRGLSRDMQVVVVVVVVVLVVVVVVVVVVEGVVGVEFV